MHKTVNAPMPFYFVMVDHTLSEFCPSIKEGREGEEGNIARDRRSIQITQSEVGVCRKELEIPGTALCWV